MFVTAAIAAAYAEGLTFVEGMCLGIYWLLRGCRGIELYAFVCSPISHVYAHSCYQISTAWCCVAYVSYVHTYLLQIFIWYVYVNIYIYINIYIQYIYIYIYPQGAIQKLWEWAWRAHVRDGQGVGRNSVWQRPSVTLGCIVVGHWAWSVNNWSRRPWPTMPRFNGLRAPRRAATRRALTWMC